MVFLRFHSKEFVLILQKYFVHHSGKWAFLSSCLAEKFLCVGSTKSLCPPNTSRSLPNMQRWWLTAISVARCETLAQSGICVMDSLMLFFSREGEQTTFPLVSCEFLGQTFNARSLKAMKSLAFHSWLLCGHLPLLLLSYPARWLVRSMKGPLCILETLEHIRPLCQSAEFGRPILVPRPTMGGSQPPVTPVPRDLTSYFGSWKIHTFLCT